MNTCPSRPRRLSRTAARLAAAALAITLPLAVAAPVAPELQPAEQALLEGRADQATTLLKAALARNNANGMAHLLLCRVYLSTLDGPNASSECRLALNNGLGHDATAQDYAGRAFGMQASHTGPFAAMKLAGQVHTAFETAHQLDPRDPAAANDLGEYYIHAPALVGGGTDKAVALANALQVTLPEIAQRLHALIAEKAGDTATAERFFLAATQVAQSPGALVDLATFYNRRHDPAKAAAAARRAVALDRAIDADVVEAAGALGDAHQSADAIAALRSYLAHGRHSDQAPTFRAHVMLGQLLAAAGDAAGARAEYTAALALAANYRPARKALDSL